MKDQEDKEIRNRLLDIAYKAAKEAGSIKGGMFDLREVTKDWEEEKKNIEFNADCLVAMGLLEWVVMGGFMRITATGIREYIRTCM